MGTQFGLVTPRSALLVNMMVDPERWIVAMVVRIVKRYFRVCDQRKDGMGIFLLTFFLLLCTSIEHTVFTGFYNSLG